MLVWRILESISGQWRGVSTKIVSVHFAYVYTCNADRCTYLCIVYLTFASQILYLWKGQRLSKLSLNYKALTIKPLDCKRRDTVFFLTVLKIHDPVLLFPFPCESKNTLWWNYPTKFEGMMVWARNIMISADVVTGNWRILDTPQASKLQ